MTNGTDPGNNPDIPWWSSLCLTPQERCVLLGSANGMTAREIAEQLEMTDNIIEDCLRQLRRKLRGHNKVNTVAIAVQLGLI